MHLSGIIVGLGNPGNEYTYTRHNYGFLMIDALLEAWSSAADINRLSSAKDPYELWRLDIRRPMQQRWFVAKPLAYMNRSGEPVQKIMNYYKLVPHQLLVLHDELDLPLGRMKMKQGGGNAGHNGLKSLQLLLGTPDFHRLRLGIGKPAGFDTSSFVLGRFSRDEMHTVAKMTPAILDSVLFFMQGDLKKAQQFCNGFQLAPS